MAPLFCLLFLTAHLFCQCSPLTQAVGADGLPPLVLPEVFAILKGRNFLPTVVKSLLKGYVRFVLIVRSLAWDGVL